MRGTDSIVRKAICNQSINMNKFCDISSRLTSAIQVQTIVAGEKVKKITTGRPVRGKKKRTDYMQGHVHLLVVVYTGLAAGIGH